MKKLVLPASLPKLCLAMGLMLGPGAAGAYALPSPTGSEQVKNEAGAMKVTGTVVDENGEPIIGASVKVKGTKISVPTDINGQFTLSGVEPNQDVQISYVGYLSTTLKASKLSRGVTSRSNLQPKTSTKSSLSATALRKKSTSQVPFNRSQARNSHSAA